MHGFLVDGAAALNDADVSMRTVRQSRVVNRSMNLHCCLAYKTIVMRLRVWCFKVGQVLQLVHGSNIDVVDMYIELVALKRVEYALSS
jgi:hypothetical protein